MQQSPSPYYRFARDFALFTNRSIFLTGKAGTGKTTFLHQLKQETKKQIAIVAPTGVAAINAGGTTMHSFFQLPFTPFVPTAEGRKSLIEKIHMQSHRRKVLQELELLVIDEISMVRADVLDAVDTILRHFRHRHNEPFGGVQLIFIGDMFQLSPVASDEEWRLLSQYYAGPYFFHSCVVLQQQPVYIELDKIYRQSNADFISVLNQVRNNCLSDEGLKLLQSRFNPLFIPPQDDTYITLTTHNYKADKINTGELSKLKGKIYRFEAEIKGEYPEKSYPTERVLELKIGAKVMFIKNDTETPRRYFNGKIGVVEAAGGDGGIIIKCPGDDEPIELHKDVWRNIRYTANASTKQIEENELGTFVQYPLRLAWAITIHKSQGLTFEKAIIDAGEAFAAGQVYVALSRCRSLEGLVLLSKINPDTIQNDRKIVDYERNKLPVQVLENHLEESKNSYRRFVLNSLFEFGSAEAQAQQLQSEVKKSESSFNEETIPFLENVLQQTRSVREVAVRFQPQLQSILNSRPVDEDFLQSRIQSAAGFFTEKITALLETISQSPAVTDSRDNAAAYNDGLKTLFSNLAQKRFLLKGLEYKFTVEDYYILKNTFILPEFKVNAYAKNTNPKNVMSTRHPELYWELARCRNQICEPDNIPIYIVAGTKTLNEMSDYLPQTEKELLHINGFGPAKVEKYGKAFLEVINAYCTKHQLQSLIHEKEKAPKEPKIESRLLSLQLYKEGKSIEKIAGERGLAISTIGTHLIQYLGDEVDINDFISPEKRNSALRVLEQNESENVSAYQLLNHHLTKTELQFFLAWRRRNNS